MSNSSELRRVFEITYHPPSSGALASAKSLSTHHFMRYARDCHKQLLNHLSNENLLDHTGQSSVIETESKTVIECTPPVVEKIRTLPFVARVEEAANSPR